jgi:putative transposase
VPGIYSVRFCPEPDHTDKEFNQEGMMRKYRNKDVFYIEMPVTGWIDLFVRESYMNRISESLKWCCEKKGMRLAEYVILPNRVVLIAGSAWGSLPQTIAIFENFTSKAMMSMIRNGFKDPRKKWLTETILKYGLELPDGTRSIWQRYQLQPILSLDSGENKIRSIYQLPLEAGFVLKAEDYKYCSANRFNPLAGWLDGID